MKLIRTIDSKIVSGETVVLVEEQFSKIIDELLEENYLWWTISTNEQGIVTISARECMTIADFDSFINRTVNQNCMKSFSKHLIFCQSCDRRYQDYLQSKGLR